MNPKHIRQVPNHRKAVAPYNFVELPDQVVQAERQNNTLRDHNSYYGDRNTGRIECTLTTSSPVYTRCGLTPAQFSFYQQQLRQGKEVPDYPDFCYVSPETKHPVIPGSSLRGMFRTLVEIISFSKIDKVSDHQRFFFRAVAAENDDPLKKQYENSLGKYGRKVKAGYLHQENGQWFIHPACEIDTNKNYLKVKEDDIEQKRVPSLIRMKKEYYLPQYINVSFERDGESIRVSENTQEYKNNQGWLVTSGNMLETSNLTEEAEREEKLHSKEGRKYHYIISMQTTGERLEISPDAISDYKASLTSFQNGKCFEDNPNGNPFHEDRGVLQEGIPIFYCQPEPGKSVQLFGQSPNFRIPYIPKGKTRAATAVDFIPNYLKDRTIIDLADAIFGWIRQEKPENRLPEGLEKQRAGRVFFSDAKYNGDSHGIWYARNQTKTVIPQILASPKPTTFQHYLVQPEETQANKENLKHYGNQPGEDTVIRGHKLYWHKGSKPSFEHPNPEDVSDTQTTQIKPINPGVTFKFTIHFENLSDVELGALMWVLDIARNDSYRLKLGMGKPLGMGAVKIESRLYLSNRQQRYSQLFKGKTWETGETLDDAPDYQQSFENYILEHLRQTGKFTDIPRIRMLLELLRWYENPSPKYLQQRRYMEIERQQSPRIGEDKNEYKQRPVLPTPLDIMGITPKGDRTSSPPKPNPQRTVPPHPVKQFSEGEVVKATVVEIKREQVQKGKKTQLRTTISYKIAGSDCLSKEEINKQKVTLAVGDIVKVRVIKGQGTSVRKVKRVE